MRRSVFTSALVALVAGLGVAVLSVSLGVSPELEWAAVIGALVASVLGVAVLVKKSRVASTLEPGPKGMKQLMSVQVVTLLVRLLAVLVGAFATKQMGLEPLGYVVSFFVCYVVHQFIEMRFVLNASAQVPKSGPVEVQS